MPIIDGWMLTLKAANRSFKIILCAEHSRRETVVGRSFDEMWVDVVDFL